MHKIMPMTFLCYAQSTDSDHLRISLCKPRIHGLLKPSEDFVAQTMDLYEISGQ